MKYIQFKTIGLIGIGVASWLTACGVGGSSSPTVVAPAIPSPAPVNEAPTAAIMASSTAVPEDSTFTLDASGSTDPENDGLTYLWEQISGPDSQIDSPQSVETQVTFGSVVQNEAARFVLTVSDGEAEATDEIEITVQNVRDVPDENGKLTILTVHDAVTVTPNLSDPETPKFILVEENPDGTTAAKRYSIDFDENGRITEGRLESVDAGFDDYGPDVDFVEGFSRLEPTFMAVTPQGALLMRDSVNEPAQTFEVYAELSGENICALRSFSYYDVLDERAAYGGILAGHRNGGASLYTWDTTNPSDVTRRQLGGSKSYCGIARGSSGGRASVRTTVTVILTDVDGRTYDLHTVGLRFGFPTTISFSESFPFPDIGLDDALSFVSASPTRGVMMFSDGLPDGKHQSLYASISLDSTAEEDEVLIDLLQVFGGIIPSQTIRSIVFDYDGDVPADQSFYFGEGDRQNYIYVSGENSSIIRQYPGEFLSESLGPVVELDVGLNVKNISTEAVPGHLVVTFQETNRIDVIPLPFDGP